MKLFFKTPIDNGWMRFFHNTISQEHTDYRFSPSWETLMQLRQISADETLLFGSPSIADVLRLTGSHCTLWIGDCQGIVAPPPPDVEPQGWTFGNGKTAVPREYFWAWYPDEEVQAKMLAQQPAFLGELTSIFKSLVPYQLRKAHGELLGIDAIPVLRLPGLVRQDLDWVFEWGE